MSSSSAERTREYRRRKREDRYSIRVEVGGMWAEFLIERGFLDGNEAGDREAIEEGTEDFLEMLAAGTEM